MLILEKRAIFSYQLSKYKVSKYILNKLYQKKLCIVSRDTTNLINHSDNLLNKNISWQLNINDILKLQTICNKKIKFLTYVIIRSSNFLKKEMYLFLLIEILKKGLKVLILVSSIFNIYKLKKYFDTIFNVTVDIYNSQLSESKKLLIWTKSKNGELSIIISTHKGVFLPILKLGMIIVDEENSLSYKISEKWKYNLKNLAIARAYKENIPIILETSEPSLETLYNINKKKFKAIHVSALNKNYNLCKFIHTVIDIKNQRLKGVFSEKLISRVFSHLNDNNQVCFIVNGIERVFTVLQCLVCFGILRCKFCNQFFHVNIHSKTLFCKYCLFYINKLIVCNLCNSISFKFIRYNVDLLKENIQDIFFDVPIFFINKEKIFSDNVDINKNTSDHIKKRIIIGEDKLIKEHLFKKVTLVVFLCIDIFFYSTNFRSIEYFGQLYNSSMRFFEEQQLNSIEFIIQTKTSDNIFLIELLKNGYKSFSHRLLATRKKHKLPPFYYHVMIYAKSKKKSDLVFFLINYNDSLIKKLCYFTNKLWSVGPYPVLFNKDYKFFYSKILLAHPSRIFIKNLLRRTIDFSNTCFFNKKIKLIFDMDGI